MASGPRIRPRTESDKYPTRDGRPMGETPTHRDGMMALIYPLQRHFEADPNVYVSGNMLMFYVPGNKRKHISPDVFVTFGIPNRLRKNYLVWEEGKGPDFVLELTSASTRPEDTETKFALYRDVLGVREYFLFDPFEEYLRPSFQGYRLLDGQYVPIEPVEGRLPSEVLGLHLEREGSTPRLYNLATGLRLLTPAEAAYEHERAEAARLRAEVELARAEREREQAELARLRAEAELERMSQEVERLRQELESRRGRPADEA